jgi:hypothetical protein
VVEYLLSPGLGLGDALMTRMFVIYASKDYPFYERLAAQARTARLQVEFDHLEVKQPWVPAWKAQCRNRVCKSDGAIVLVSRNTIDGGIDWELECAADFGIPILGVNVDKEQKGSVPKEPPGWVVTDWADWPGIARFIQSAKGLSASSH